MKRITVESFYQQGKERLRLTQTAARDGLTERYVVSVDVNRLGMALTGFLKWFAYERIQILGKTEVSYLKSMMSASRRREVFHRVLSYRIPCVVATHRMRPPPELLKEAQVRRIPVFTTPTTTTKFIQEVSSLLEEIFAPETTLHGTLLDVYGVGVLLLGDSGIGKSECALELVERGHRLVADDLVYVKRLAGRILMGSRSEIVKHHMEIRGLGIINVESLFGVGAIRDRKRVELVVRLEEWDNRKEYERLGMTQDTFKIFDVTVPMYVIPVRPGRNLSVIIEVAAMNHRLRKLGYFTAQEFAERVSRLMRENPEKAKTRLSERRRGRR